MTDSLPPLPDPYGVLGIPVFTADQMREYAAAAVAAEREACARVCDEKAEASYYTYGALRCAAAIRSRK